MIRRPPRSTRTDTLFPYTTLCRSQGILVAGARGDDRMELDLGAEWLGTVREQRLDRAEHRRPRAVVGVDAVPAAAFPPVLSRHAVVLDFAAAESVARLLGLAHPPPPRQLRFPPPPAACAAL